MPPQQPLTPTRGQNDGYKRDSEDDGVETAYDDNPPDESLRESTRAGYAEDEGEFEEDEGGVPRYAYLIIGACFVFMCCCGPVSSWGRHWGGRHSWVNHRGHHMFLTWSIPDPVTFKLELRLTH